MKGKIDERGQLRMERAGTLRKQACPFDTSGEAFCGDWCPLFGEPEPQMHIAGIEHTEISGGTVEAETFPVCKTHVEISWTNEDESDECEKFSMTSSIHIPGTPTGRTLLKICQDRTLIFDEFTDERK